MYVANDDSDEFEQRFQAVQEVQAGLITVGPIKV